MAERNKLCNQAMLQAPTEKVICAKDNKQAILGKFHRQAKIFTGGLQLALIIVFSLLILQQIDGNFIGPRIMGDALKLNPMLIIISITIGGAYFGVLGMFLSVPAAAMLKLFVNDILFWRETKLAEKI